MMMMRIIIIIMEVIVVKYWSSSSSAVSLADWQGTEGDTDIVFPSYVYWVLTDNLAILAAVSLRLLYLMFSYFRHLIFVLDI